MIADRYGLQLTTRSATARDAYNDGLLRLISFDAGAAASFHRAIGADPGFGLAHLGLAVLFWHERQTNKARDLLSAAAGTLDSATERERRLGPVVQAVVEGHGHIDRGGYQAPNSEALRLLQEHLADFPRDALALYLLIIHTIFSGRPGEVENLRDLLDRLAPEYEDDWWFLSWRSLCYEEVHDTVGARPLAERAFALQPRGVTAAHGRAHVLYAEGQYRESAEFLRDWLRGCDDDALYASHVSWHFAIADLLLGDVERALATFHDHIDPAAVDSVRTTFTDAVCFLWRCVLYAPEQQQLPWDGARRYAAGFAEKPGIPFRDAVAAAAFVGCGDRQSFDHLTGHLRALDSEDHPLAGSLILPLAEGLSAFREADYEGTIRRLEPIVGELRRLGGSNHQRETFEETLWEAYCRAGQADRLRSALARVWTSHPPARIDYWLKRAARWDRAVHTA